MVPLERNLFGYPLVGLLWERRLEDRHIVRRSGEVAAGNVFISPTNSTLSVIFRRRHKIGWTKNQFTVLCGTSLRKN